MKKKPTKKQQRAEEEKKKKIKSLSNAQDYIKGKIKKQNREYLKAFDFVQREAKGNFKRKINPKDKKSKTYKTYLEAELKKITNLNNKLKELQERRTKITNRKPRQPKELKTISIPKKGIRRINNSKDTTSGGGFFAWSFNDFVETIKPLNFFGVDAKTFEGKSFKKQGSEILSDVNAIFRRCGSNDMLILKMNLANGNLFFEVQVGERLKGLERF